MWAAVATGSGVLAPPISSGTMTSTLTCELLEFPDRLRELVGDLYPGQGETFHLLQNLGRPGRDRPHPVGADCPVVIRNRIGVEDGYPLLFLQDSRKYAVPVLGAPSPSGTVESTTSHEVANLLVG